MDLLDRASLRILGWRVEGLPARTGQSLQIGVLVWAQIRSPLVVWWLVAAILSGVAELYQAIAQCFIRRGATPKWRPESDACVIQLLGWLRGRCMISPRRPARTPAR